jgi:hypothetical protein
VKLFSDWCRHLHARLIQSDGLEKADLVFVLAGHRVRKVYCARLFRDGWAPRVLMSTGNPPYIAQVLEREVMPARAQSVQAWAQVHDATTLPSPSEGHFFASLGSEEWSVEPIAAGWFGTLSEIKALAAWLEQRPSIHSLLIVSSGMHLKRVRMCCRRLLPQDRKVRLIAVPADVVDVSAHGGMREREGPYRICLEWSKVLLYCAVLTLSGRPRGSAECLL